MLNDLSVVRLVESAIIAVPSLVTIVTVVNAVLNKIFKKTAEFPTQLKQTNLMIQDTTADLKEIVDRNLTKIGEGLKGDMKSLSDNMVTNLFSSLQSMATELTTYKKEIIDSRIQSNNLIKENMVFKEVIIGLIAKNPEMVRSGIATVVSTNLNTSIAELRNLPENLLAELPLLKKALSEALTVLGKEKISEILKEIGYE